LNVAARRDILGVPALHPQDVLRHAGLDSCGEAAAARGDAGEESGVISGPVQAGDDHSREPEVACRRRPFGNESPTAARRAGKKRWAEAAAPFRMDALGTGRVDREPGVAHEALEKRDDVVLRTPRHPEPGLMALAELVVLAHLDVDGHSSHEALVSCLLVKAQPQVADLQIDHLGKARADEAPS